MLFRSDGTITVFDPPHAKNSWAIGFDGQGNIVGSFQTEKIKALGFIRSPDGTITVVNYPRSLVTAFYSVNASGTITGERIGKHIGSGDRAFVRSPDGTFTLFDAPGALGTAGQSINDAGTVAGSFYDETTDHGFVRALDGTITNFDPKHSVDTEVYGINAGGVIIGTYDTADEVTHGFLRKPAGTIMRFDAPDAVYATTPRSINKSGVIAGTYTDTSRTTYHGFIRTP